MAKAGARGLQCQLKTSEKVWAHLAKFEVLRIVDFWQFWEKCQISTMHNFFNFELLAVFVDFLETLRCPLIITFGIIAF